MPGEILATAAGSDAGLPVVLGQRGDSIATGTSAKTDGNMAGEKIGLPQEEVGVVTVVRTTATEDGVGDAAGGGVRPLTISPKVVVGDAGGEVGQLLAGRGDGHNGGVADGVVGIARVAGVVRPEASGGVGVLRFEVVPFLGLVRDPGEDLGVLIVVFVPGGDLLVGGVTLNEDDAGGLFLSCSAWSTRCSRGWCCCGFSSRQQPTSTLMPSFSLMALCDPHAVGRRSWRRWRVTSLPQAE